MDSSHRKPVRAIAYARTSKVLDQDPMLQIEAIREFARARGFVLIGEYIDQVTGDRERRPGLDAVNAEIKRGKVDVVIVTALDRVFRSTKSMLNTMDEWSHYRTTVCSIREQLDFSSPAGRMALTVLAAVATLEKQIISERIRTSLAVKKMTAQRLGTGWRCGRKAVATDEVVRRVLELRGQGLSVRQIEAAMDKRISRGSVQRILKAYKDGSSGCPETVRCEGVGRALQVVESPAQSETGSLSNGDPTPVGDGTGVTPLRAGGRSDE